MWPVWFKPRVFWGWVSLLAAVELVSWLSYSFPDIRAWLTYGCWVIFFVICCYRLQYGVYAILAELVIGSQGYILAAPIGGFTVSLRLGLFLLIVLASCIDVIRRRRLELLGSFYWKWFALLTCCIGLGIVVAMLFGNSLSNIFFDVNGYLFIGLFFPVTQALRRREQLQTVLTVILAGVFTLTIQTLAIVFVFSHPATFQYYLSDIYRWIRDFRIGEITQQPNGFYRVFFQSHIYVVFVLLLAQINLMKRWQWWAALVATAAILLLFLSYSRSFWLATIMIVGILWVWQWWLNSAERRRLWLTIATTISGFVLAYGIILAVVNIPIGGSGSGVSAASLLTERTDNPLNEAAGGSRMALLQPLLKKNLEHPLTGMGFGTTVTYETKDPRALASNPSGLYTTYAFEWGYLDLWLKLGVLGLIVYGTLLALIIGRTLMLAQTIGRSDEFATSTLFVASFGTLGVVLIHGLTPYLNHPLGLGWIVLAAVITDLYAKTR